jgi:prolyl 4-hydroxylase
MFFQRGENELVSKIEERIGGLLDWPWKTARGLQVLHYTPGTEYKPHYDYFDLRTSRHAPVPMRRGGQRGCHGHHVPGPSPRRRRHRVSRRAPGSRPQARQRRVLQLRPGPPFAKTLHGGAPVLAGEKWIAPSGCASAA